MPAKILVVDCEPGIERMFKLCLRKQIAANKYQFIFVYNIKHPLYLYIFLYVFITYFIFL